MKKALLRIFLITYLAVFSAGIVQAATYTGIGPFTGNFVTLDLTSFDFDYIDQSNYRVLRLDWEIENTSVESFFDVQLVIPFVWGVIENASPARQDYTWNDSTQEWIYNGVSGGNDGVDDGLYVRAYNDALSASYGYLQMSNTDLPLSSDPGSLYTTAQVLSSDSLLSYAVAGALGAGQKVSFSTFLEIEKRSASPSLGGLWFDAYVVANVPIPSAAWLLGTGLIGLITIRRKFKN